MSRPLRNRSRGAVFLGYHSVHENGPEWLSVPPEAFEGQLAALRRAGWQSGTESRLRALARGDVLDGPTAFLTFDDGFADNFDMAFPALREHDLGGMFFVLPSHLDNGAPLDWGEVEGHVRRHPDVMRSLTWRQVETMAENGMTFGSHGMSHAHLTKLSSEQLSQELLDSRRLIADRLGHCDTLAYPFGEWAPRVAEAARAAGYSLAFTLPRRGQREVTPWSVPRIPVDRRDVGTRFALKLRPLGRRLYLSRAKALAGALGR